MGLKILIVDDSKDFRSLLRLFLNKVVKGCEIIEYDLHKHGRPSDEFDWSVYDVMLLDYKLGKDEDGLEWLKEFGQQKDFPPTVILTAEGDEYVAVRSIKLGASDYINKKDVNPKRLAQVVEEAISYNEDKRLVQQQSAKRAEKIYDDMDESQKLDSVQDKGIEAMYKVIRLVGKGAMSKVYLAERKSDQLILVLKLMDISNLENDVPIKRFEQEARLMSSIDSPYVIKIYEHGITEDYGYIAMEFFSRGDLKQRLDKLMSEEVAVRTIRQILHGLSAVHQHGVVHRDLKPANIMFRSNDSLALADFGISKKITEDNELTAVGQILGTPHYMSPEQTQTDVIDGRCDLYAVGVMLYEFLTGEKPFKAKDVNSLIFQHMSAPIPQLPKQYQHYQAVVEKLMAKKPADRFANAEEALAALAR